METESNKTTTTSRATPAGDVLGKSVGKLSLTIIRAVGLPDKHLIGHNHPYIKLYLADESSPSDDASKSNQDAIKIRKQAAAEGVDGHDPFFGSEYDIELKGDRQVLHIELWSRDVLRDSQLGNLVIPITDLIKRAFDSSHLPLAFGLLNSSSQEAGTLFMAVGYESSPFVSSKSSEIHRVDDNKQIGFGPAAGGDTMTKGSHFQPDTTTDNSGAKTFPISSFPITSSTKDKPETHTDETQSNQGQTAVGFSSKPIEYGVDFPYTEQHHHPLSSAIDMGSGRQLTNDDVGIFNKKNIETGTMNYGPDKESSAYNTLRDQPPAQDIAMKHERKDKDVGSHVTPASNPSGQVTGFNLGMNYKPETTFEAGEWGSSNVGSTGASIGTSKLGESDKDKYNTSSQYLVSSNTPEFGGRSDVVGKSASNDSLAQTAYVSNVDDKLPSLHIGTSHWGGGSNINADESNIRGSSLGKRSTSSDVGASRMDVSDKRDINLGSSDFGSVKGSLSSDIGTSSYNTSSTSSDVGVPRMDVSDKREANLGSRDFGSVKGNLSSDIGTSSYNTSSTSSDVGAPRMDVSDKGDTNLGSSDFGRSEVGSSVGASSSIVGEKKDTSFSSSLEKDKYRALEHGTLWAKDNLGSGLTSTSQSSPSTDTSSENVNTKPSWAEEMLHNKFKDSISGIQDKQQPWATAAVDPLDPNLGVKGLSGALDQMTFDQSKDSNQSSTSAELSQEVGGTSPQSKPELQRHPGYGKHEPTEYQGSAQQSELQPSQQNVEKQPAYDKSK